MGREEANEGWGCLFLCIAGTAILALVWGIAIGFAWLVRSKYPDLGAVGVVALWIVLATLTTMSALKVQTWSLRRVTRRVALDRIWPEKTDPKEQSRELDAVEATLASLVSSPGRLRVDVFVSYLREDHDLARRVARVLRRRGLRAGMYSPKKPWKRTWSVIMEALRRAPVLLMVGEASRIPHGTCDEMRRLPYDKRENREHFYVRAEREIGRFANCSMFSIETEEDLDDRVLSSIRSVVDQGRNLVSTREIVELIVRNKTISMRAMQEENEPENVGWERLMENQDRTLQMLVVDPIAIPYIFLRLFIAAVGLVAVVVGAAAILDFLLPPDHWLKRHGRR